MTAAATSIEISREAVVAEARSWIGTPFHVQASAKGAGCDCLGLVRGVWRAVVGPEPDAPTVYRRATHMTVLAAWRRHGMEIGPDALAAGDVAVFRIRDGRSARHCGILTAPDRFVQAMERVGVRESALAPWWRRRIVLALRFPGVI